MSKIASDLPPAYSPAAYDPWQSTAAQAQEAQNPYEKPPSYPLPPGIAHEKSNKFNASADDAARASSWCNVYPLTPPFPLSSAQSSQIRNQDHVLIAPSSFRGQLTRVSATTNTPASHGWLITGQRDTTDSLCQTQLPIYSYFADNPLYTQRAKTIYFEIRILSLDASSSSSHVRAASQSIRKRLLSRRNRIEPVTGQDAGVAIGYFAPPYPPFRLPGWERASLAVHSDDGRRYVTNPEGGLDFTEPFKPGETIGLGINFVPISLAGNDKKQQAISQPIDVTVFLTRNGRQAGGWNLTQDTDVEAESVAGLTGQNDLFPAVGVFGPVQVEVHFQEKNWLYRGGQ